MVETSRIIEIVIGYINPQMIYEIVLTFLAVSVIVYIFNSDLVSGTNKEKVDKDEERRKQKIETLKRANERIKRQNDLKRSLNSKGRG